MAASGSNDPQDSAAAAARQSTPRQRSDGKDLTSSSAGGCDTSKSKVQPPPMTPQQQQSSTWPIFLLHFVLPMSLLILASNSNEICDALFSLASPKPKSPITSLGNTKPSTKPSSLPTRTQSLSDSKFQGEIDAAIERRKKQKNLPQQSESSSTRQRSRSTTAGDGSTKPAKPYGPQSSPLYKQMEAQIKQLKAQYDAAADTPDEYLVAIRYADFLKHRDITIHDGGTYQMEAIEVYSRAIDLLEDIWREKMAKGEDTRSSPVDTSSSDRGYPGLNKEMFFDYESKSIEGALCAAYTSLGKVYFMSNMFERAVQSVEECLSYDHDYLEGLTNRAQSFLILGRYAEAGRDYKRVLQMDVDRYFVDSFTGLSKVLTAKEDAVPGGWEFLVDLIERELPMQKQLYDKVKLTNNAGGIKHYADGLKRMHHAMFAYHDVKTKDASEAWFHLAKGNEYKMSTVAPFDPAMKKEQVERMKQVFTPTFFPDHVGSQTDTPIFIIGFVRSGSTLLERILDAHPLIVGTGEDSVFNGRLDTIRNEIVEASLAGDPRVLQQVVKRLADDVVEDMKSRWEVIDANLHREDEEDEHEEERPYPTRFADKMLTNYFNVGFIHLLFPNALILHVAREPMDSIFSAFKHDFPPGGLDYTSEFASLAQLYHSYRDVMEHWDKVLPGRVTHIRYEDMVTDLPNVAPKIIAAAGVPWDPTVLDFHKKKQAVNTLSTTQVRKGVYSHHLKGWKRYKDFLGPLLDLIGLRVNYSLKTNLPGYVRPDTDDA